MMYSNANTDNHKSTCMRSKANTAQQIAVKVHLCTLLAKSNGRFFVQYQNLFDNLSRIISFFGMCMLGIVERTSCKFH